MKSDQQASNMDFDSMKYADLRSLAKELGLKANMKAHKLLEAIKQHYQQKAEESQAQEKEAADVPEDENASNAPTNAETYSKEDIFNPPVFVNTRRGKANGTKRKISDTSMANEWDVHCPPAYAEGDTEDAVSSASRGARRGKKRKVSSAKDKESVSTGLKSEVRDELPTTADTEKVSKIAKAGKIPRLQKKTGTPNFKKLHEAHFNKMESIDSYVQRKTKNLETYRGSAKDSKKPPENTKQQQPKSQERANRVSLLSPAPNRRAAEEKHNMLSASKAPPNKPAWKKDAAFRPSVLSISRINVRFAEAPHDDEDNKRSMVKTPAHMSSCVASSTPLKQPTDKGKPNSVKTAVLSATKTPGPFVFTGNTSNVTTPGTQKPKFDLKASLSRPLTYKPHAGKLKPFGDVKENTTASKSLVSVSSHQKHYKRHQPKTREDRRAKQMQDRKQKKEGVLESRRGLVLM